MGLSLVAFKSRTYRELYENLHEIFDSEPFQVVFSLEDTTNWIESEVFVDRKGNKIKVYFHKMGREYFELDFTFNGNSSRQLDTPNYSMKEFSELLNTVAKVVSQFLEEYSPKGVMIMGNNNFSKSFKDPRMEKQKDRIYAAFLSKVLDLDGKYGVEKSPGHLCIVRRN